MTLPVSPNRVVLIDDHDLFREGLHQLLKQSPLIDIVGTASSGEDGLNLCQQLMPDVVLLDLNMPNLSGLETLQDLLAWKADLPVIILTLSDEIDDLLQCMSLGAQGFVLKNAKLDFLVAAITQTVRGNKVMSQEMTDKIIHKVNTGALESQEEQYIDFSVLTEREQEVLHYIAQGKSNKIIAHQMALSENTVKVYVQNILKKLHLRSRVQAAIMANKQMKN